MVFIFQSLCYSNVASATYTAKVATPTFSPAPGTFTGSVTVSIFTTTSGATIRYTTSGTTPTSSSPVYSRPLTFTSTTTLKAKAFKSGMTDSNAASATYTAKVATPTFSPTPGAFTGSVTVSISTTTSGATIRYTTSGTTPTSSSPVYSRPLTFTSTTTLKAKAFKSGMTDSNAASATYTAKVATPTFSPTPGAFTGSVTVSISTTTSGATIRYTTSGTTPTSSSPVYSRPLTFTSTTTLKAKAFKSGMTDSNAASATYTVSSKIVVGYFPSWSETNYYTKIKYDNLTHVAHAFAIPNADGSLDTGSISSQISGFVSTIHQYKKKAILSIGGWGWSANFSPIASDASKRQAFAAKLKTFCELYNYDGVDIDWEFPIPLEKDNVTNLMKEIRDALKSSNRPLTLSMAIPGGYFYNSWGFDLAKLQQYVDWFGVMTYDYSRQVFADHNSPLPKCEDSINYYLNYVPSTKLLIGIPFYGKKYDCPFGPSIGAIASHIEDILYSDLPDFSQGNWQRRWANDSSVPYLINQSLNQLISYDDEESIQSKCQWLKENNLGGAIIWALGQDASGIDNTNTPLLCTVGKALLGSGCP